MSEAASYRTPRGEAVAEIEVKRSRFIARVAHAESESAARAIVDEQRAAHPKARHHCMAFVLDPRGQTQRFSDDGEPAGTAGAPILEVLAGRELTDVVAVVTRYFGGTLLGAGGLVRAYGGAAAHAADRLRIDTRELVVPVAAEFDYGLAEQVKARVEQQGWRVLSADYDAAVRLRLGAPEAEAEALLALLADLSGGRAAPERGAPEYL
ncbi:YigZ family protein [Brevibacterium sp. 5221]|uniref:YigZ family protein n=1 Tax=Brevibacterium rongguiense TaxID=2695267 RepID=A0A6N9H7D0_9MICO|nr:MULTISPECIES: YigZ family protein [Brevibacterium]MYM19676.1 YigZ family protein [Brevibacterium rongguiense]WAL39922.1 YigZ family protein [Brevibacterium sp. BRM-1]